MLLLYIYRVILYDIGTVYGTLFPPTSCNVERSFGFIINNFIIFNKSINLAITSHIIIIQPKFNLPIAVCKSHIVLCINVMIRDITFCT